MVAARITRLGLPGRADGRALVDLEREVDEHARDHPVLSLRHADTRRFPPPEWFQEALAKAVRDGKDAFTPCKGDQEALDALAGPIGSFLGVAVDPETELALTPGTQAAIYCALSALVEPNDLVLMPDPDYLSNERLLRYLGADVMHVPLERWGRSSSLDLDVLEDGLKRGARLLVLSHPSNPTGAIYSADCLHSIARLVVEYDARVLVDELYARLVYDRGTYEHLIALPGMAGRCITTLGPSKTESMSGYRIGCLIGPKDVVAAVSDVLDVTAIRAPAYAQHALTGWLSNDADWVDQRVDEFRQLRDVTVSALGQVPGVETYVPQATAYLFPDVSNLGLSDAELAKRLVTGAHVLVNPGISFGPRGVGHFRMCFAQDEAVWPSVLERIAGVLTAA